MQILNTNRTAKQKRINTFGAKLSLQVKLVLAENK